MTIWNQHHKLISSAGVSEEKPIRSSRGRQSYYRKQAEPERMWSSVPFLLKSQNDKSFHSSQNGQAQESCKNDSFDTLQNKSQGKIENRANIYFSWTSVRRAIRKTHDLEEFSLSSSAQR